MGSQGCGFMALFLGCTYTLACQCTPAGALLGSSQLPAAPVTHVSYSMSRSTCLSAALQGPRKACSSDRCATQAWASDTPETHAYPLDLVSHCY
jgi:hypothetical protein